MTNQRPPITDTVKAAKMAVAALCLAWLTGCMSSAPNTPEQISEPALNYPITADSRLVTQPILFAPGQTAIEPRDLQSLNAFLKHFFKSGGNVVEIRQLAGADDAKAQARLDTLRRHMLYLGVRPHEIVYHRIDGQDAGSGPIILSFESYSARNIECTQRNANSSHNPTNERHPDWGCALRSNIAAMIANPSDLKTPRPEQPASSARRSRVQQNYGVGAPTEAVRGAGEAVGSIRDLGGS
jgi:pilus assembly protein CpaD